MIEERDPEEIEREGQLLAKRAGIGVLIALPIITIDIAMVIKPKRGSPDFWLLAHAMLASLRPFLLFGATALIGIVVARRKRNRYSRRSKLVTMVCSAVVLFEVPQT